MFGIRSRGCEKKYIGIPKITKIKNKKQKKIKKKQKKRRPSDGSRTHANLLTRQGLYQLSYTDVCGPACSQCQPWSAGNDMAYTLQTCTVYTALEW